MFIKDRGYGKLTYYKVNKRTGKPCGVGNVTAIIHIVYSGTKNEGRNYL